ncbi:hypothetical protein KAH27_00480 [bacterium]|nr:hypothetical protein [bacterium]
MNAFEKLLVKLVEAKLYFAVIGGFACAFNGWARSTLDVDILLKYDKQNIKLLLEILSDWGDGAANELSENDFTYEPGAIRVIEEFPLDIFIRIADLTYVDIEADIKYYELSNKIKIPYVNAKTLLKIKSISHREQDKIDVIMLKNIVNKK